MHFKNVAKGFVGVWRRVTGVSGTFQDILEVVQIVSRGFRYVLRAYREVSWAFDSILGALQTL